MYEEYVSFLVLVRFFLSPVAAVFFPASFFSAGAFAGALEAGFFSAAAGFGGVFGDFGWNEFSCFADEAGG
jgi:hypothetical protein